MSMDKVNPTAVSIEKPVLLLVSLNEAQLEAGPRELLGAEQVWRLEGEMGFHREPRWRPESVTAASGQLHTQSQTAWRVRFLHCRGMPEETDSGRGGGGGLHVPCRPQFGRQPPWGLLPLKADSEQVGFTVDPVGCELHAFITNCQLSPSGATGSIWVACSLGLSLTLC